MTKHCVNWKMNLNTAQTSLTSSILTLQHIAVRDPPSR
jgi:hypothetical protein